MFLDPGVVDHAAAVLVHLWMVMLAGASTPLQLQAHLAFAARSMLRMRERGLFNFFLASHASSVCLLYPHFLHLIVGGCQTRTMVLFSARACLSAPCCCTTKHCTRWSPISSLSMVCGRVKPTDHGAGNTVTTDTLVAREKSRSDFATPYAAGL